MRWFILITFCFYSLVSLGDTFQGMFWEKKNKCTENPMGCLPKSIEKPSLFDFHYPAPGDSSEFEITGKKYVAKILIAHKLSSPDYYVIQVGLYKLNGPIVSLCSRYEAVETMESVPVGGCSGVVDPESSTLAGFSIALP